ncbi:hypothetical protein GX50_03152 [[Emmonsia] crescens]|uniref:Uncharacterized protein n=1 Tax=[Emmonsia] crescens TaxID=73230 RepID=A0A2B7ZK45_9EURO|nr:hypothetical protein GX50_03152 [Emmonsia crescens]
MFDTGGNGHFLFIIRKLFHSDERSSKKARDEKLSEDVRKQADLKERFQPRRYDNLRNRPSASFALAPWEQTC